MGGGVGGLYETLNLTSVLGHGVRAEEYLLPMLFPHKILFLPGPVTFLCQFTLGVLVNLH